MIRLPPQNRSRSAPVPVPTSTWLPRAGFSVPDRGDGGLHSPAEFMDATGTETPVGRDFSQLPVHAPAREPGRCPFARSGPRACPFGGACHICPARIQAKVGGGGLGDVYEQEADRVAEAVMQTPEPSAARHELVVQPRLRSAEPQRQRRPEAGRGGGDARPSLLQDCASWPRASCLGTVVSMAGTLARQGVSGLEALTGHWATPATSPLEQATAMGLRRGFNMEPDKSDWIELGVATADEVAALEARDRPAADTILANFRQIAADAPHYRSAPACTRTLVSGSPCLGCVAAEHGRCRNGALAFVMPEMIGQPSSPILFCPAFFTGNVGEMAACFLHELAHLQPFAARDKIGDIRYYGCPVAPIDPGGTGLRDPNEFIRIADSYRCFVETQREYRGAYERQQREEQSAREALPTSIETSPAGTEP